MSQKRTDKDANPRSKELDNFIKEMSSDNSNSFETADSLPENVSLTSPSLAKTQAANNTSSSSVAQDDDNREASGFRYKSPPRHDDVYRSYSVSLPDRQYEQIKRIRFSEMERLDRNISIAQVIRELIDIGLENTSRSRLFTKDRLRR